MPERAPRKNGGALAERSAVIATAIIAGLLHYSFSGDKPAHIDEPQDIYAARQIISDPLHPGGFPLHQAGEAVPGTVRASAGPPVWPAILSIPMRAFGEKPEGLHLAMIPFTSLAVLASGLAAAILGVPAVPVALLAGISPLFAVYASALMPDLPAVAVALSALLCFFRSHSSPKWGPMGALLFALSSLLHPSVLALFPVILLASIWKGRGLHAILWPVAGLAGSLAWPIASFVLEPEMARDSAGITSWGGAWALHAAASKASFAIATLAGAVVHPGIWVVLLCARLGQPDRLRHPRSLRNLATSRPGRTIIAGILSLLLLALLWAGGAWRNPLPPATAVAPLGINALWFAGAGFAFIAWLFTISLESGRKGASLPLIWVALSIAWAVCAPATSSRFILPAFPAVIILLVRDMNGILRPGLRRITMGALTAGTLWLAIGLVQADMRLARAPGDLLDIAGKALAKAGMKGVLASGWGYLYQGMDRGFLVPARDRGALAPGRSLIITEVAPMNIATLGKLKTREWLVLYSEAPELPLRTMQPGSSAGFYGNGCLPYSFSTTPVEKAVIARVFWAGGRRQDPGQ